jgi:hypothetical protein
MELYFTELKDLEVWVASTKQSPTSIGIQLIPL